jgi:two-component system sensor histidine kinase ChiS
MICAARFHPPVYPTLHTFFNVLMLPIIAIVLAHSVSHYRRYRTAESLWYLAGFSALGPILAVYSLSVAGIWWVWLDRLIFEQSRFLHAFFVLLFCMGMVLRVRVRSVYAQVESHAAELERLNGSLEHLVQERTAELEHANRHLIDSVHETAQALAEVSVLEERTRIAHDMHDQVGHTLTAAMIQIEAAKLLLAGDPDRAAMKMDAARETVREGLDHVRRTVRVLKTADEQEALPPALLGLIRRTEEQTGINVEYSITPLPVIDEALSATLYRALQEGLTNGMRHGGSTKFAFELSFEGSSIRFRLSSDGRKYEPGPFGFGLTAMKERVERHGGTFAIAANGNSGCLLAIDIPLSESP